MSIDEVQPRADEAPEELWALVEIFGHRQHYGRVTEVERFGTKMMRVDVPTAEPDQFETFFYGGGSIFSMTPMTEDATRKWNERYRPRPYKPLSALPPPEVDHEDEGREPF